MNKALDSSFDSDPDMDEMLPEYRFDYAKGKPNPYLGRVPVTVSLDEDVAKVFSTSEEVNNVLRAIIVALPERAVLER